MIVASGTIRAEAPAHAGRFPDLDGWIVHFWDDDGQGYEIREPDGQLVVIGWARNREIALQNLREVKERHARTFVTAKPGEEFLIRIGALTALTFRCACKCGVFKKIDDETCECRMCHRRYYADRS